MSGECMAMALAILLWGTASVPFRELCGRLFKQFTERHGGRSLQRYGGQFSYCFVCPLRPSKSCFQCNLGGGKQFRNGTILLGGLGLLLKGTLVDAGHFGVRLQLDPRNGESAVFLFQV